MPVPLLYLIKRESIIYRVYEEEALGSFHPEMCQIVNIIITGSIPDCKVESGLYAILRIYNYCFVKVLYGDSVVLPADLSSALQEGFDQHGLSDMRVTHYDYFGSFLLCFILFLPSGDLMILNWLSLNLFLIIIGSKPFSYFLCKTLFLLN